MQETPRPSTSAAPSLESSDGLKFSTPEEDVVQVENDVLCRPGLGEL